MRTAGDESDVITGQRQFGAALGVNAIFGKGAAGRLPIIGGSVTVDPVPAREDARAKASGPSRNNRV